MASSPGQVREACDAAVTVLADAFASGDQPGVVHAPASKALGQLPLGLAMADQDTRLARVRKAFEAVGLGQRLGILDRG